MALLELAVRQAFDGGLRDAALEYLRMLEDAKGERDALEAIRRELMADVGALRARLAEAEDGARKAADARADAEARAASLDNKRKRVRMREKAMARGQVVCADGLPAVLGETLFGADGRGWEIVGVSDEAAYELSGAWKGGRKTRRKDLKAEWLTHEPPAKKREPEKPEAAKAGEPPLKDERAACGATGCEAEGGR